MAKYDYDLIVIGGGAGGFVAAKTANGFNKKVAIIEKRKLGGECTWFGCVPSKTLIKVSSIAHSVKNLNNFGLNSQDCSKINTENVMEYVRSVIQKVYNGHLPETFERIGIKIFSGESEFIDNHKIKINDKIITSDKFIISTGSSAFIPQITGINTVPYLTNETFFGLKKLPDSIIILGAGPIGIELSQALNRLYVDTTVVEMSDRILFREDKEVSNLLAEQLKSEGVKILTKTKAVKLYQENSNIFVTVKDENGKGREIKSTAILVAVGRKPNTDGLKLENAGIKFNSKSIITDEYLKTDAENIYACGDVVGPYQFSHIAEYQAVTATINSFLPFKKKVNYENVIWCIYTHPELSRSGLTEEEARERYNDKIKIYRYEYNKLDRAKTDSEEIGLGKFICDNKGKLIGVHILGNHSSDVLHEAQLLKSLNIKFHKIQNVIHSYPTYSEVVKQAAKKAYIERIENNIFIKLLKKIIPKRD